MNKNSLWNEIPTLALTQIYKYLDKKDLLNASIACIHWRSVLFQRKFFKTTQFKLHVDNERKCNFYLQTLFNLTCELVIVFDFFNVYHIDKVKRILYKLSRNDNIHGIRFETNSVGLLPPGEICEEDLVNVEKSFIEPIKQMLLRKRPSIKNLDLGCIEALTYFATDFLKSLSRPQDLQLITFASIKYNPSHYPILSIDHVFFEKCTSLQVLSLDYDTINEELLRAIQILPLKKFMICVHGFDRGHPGISEQAWRDFSYNARQIDLILTLIHAYEAVEVLHTHLLRRHMPLTHLRVLFSNYINFEALMMLSDFYKDTLKSVYWIDSAYQESERNVMDLVLRSSQDPFVMMSWLCKKLVEIVVHGYVFDPHNLVGIARLCGRNLKKLEVSMVDLEPPSHILKKIIQEISSNLCQKWKLANCKNLHPALGYIPVSEDICNEYILDLIRADLCN